MNELDIIIKSKVDKTIKDYLLRENIDVANKKIIRIPFIEFRKQQINRHEVLNALKDSENIKVLNSVVDSYLKGSLKDMKQIVDEVYFKRFTIPQKPQLRELSMVYLLIKINF